MIPTRTLDATILGVQLHEVGPGTESSRTQGFTSISKRAGSVAALRFLGWIFG